MDIKAVLKNAATGDDFEADEKLATAGIRLGEHGNAIEIYHEDLEVAKQLRDAALKLMQEI